MGEHPVLMSGIVVCATLFALGSVVGVNGAVFDWVGHHALTSIDKVQLLVLAVWHVVDTKIHQV